MFAKEGQLAPALTIMRKGKRMEAVGGICNAKCVSSEKLDHNDTAAFLLCVLDVEPFILS